MLNTLTDLLTRHNRSGRDCRAQELLPHIILYMYRLRFFLAKNNYFWYGLVEDTKAIFVCEKKSNNHNLAYVILLEFIYSYVIITFIKYVHAHICFCVGDENFNL